MNESLGKQKIFDLALKTFLFLSPIFVFRTYQLSAARGMLFLFGSFALFGLSLIKEPQRKLTNGWLALVVLWGLIRIFAGEFADDANEWFNFWLSSAGFIYILAGAMLFHTVYCHADNITQYFKPILAVCILNLILVLAQITGHDFMWTSTPSLCGFASISSQLGQYSALSIPLLYFINPYLILIPLITLIASKSISSIVALCIGIIFFSWKKKVRWILLLLLIPLLVGGLNFL